MTILHPSVADHLARLGVDAEVLACESEFADTAAFCERYGVDPADSANTILVASRRPPGVHALCLVLATHRLDVNKAVREALAVKKLSFATAETTLELTGMEIGGVTPFGVAETIPVLVDSAVMDRERIVLGGGNRVSKLRLDPAALAALTNVRVIERLANEVSATEE